METEGLYITNAPKDYDYNYVETVGTLVSKDNKVFRVIEVSDELRFRNCQIPRYGSGLKVAFEFDSEDAKYHFGEDALKSFEPKGPWD